MPTQKPAPKPVIDAIGRVTHKSVLKCTGQGWDFWVKTLDRAGARSWTHKEIVAFLAKKYRLSPWWEQGVATSYEQYIGKKVEGRNEKGLYQVTSTKSLSVSQKQVWKILTSPEGMDIWMRPMSPFSWKPKNTFEVEGGIFGEVRTMKAPLRARLSWKDELWDRPSYLQVLVVARPGNKSILCFMHDGLKDVMTRDRMRDRWKKALVDFKTFIEGQTSSHK